MYIYLYKPGVFVYDTCIDIEDNVILPENATLIAPLPYIDDCISIIWNINKHEWEYHEIALCLTVRQGYMDELLTYADIRKLQYPPKEDYLDAIVKNDMIALQNYTDKCLTVKEKWSKDMKPITRREYYIREYNMISHS